LQWRDIWLAHAARAQPYIDDAAEARGNENRDHFSGGEIPPVNHALLILSHRLNLASQDMLTALQMQMRLPMLIPQYQLKVLHIVLEEV